VLDLLREMNTEKALRAGPSQAAARFKISGDFNALAGCEVVIASIFENVEDKREVLKKIEPFVSPETIIGSNTSAIPMTILQEGMVYPGRVLGIHWGEPAQTFWQVKSNTVKAEFRISNFEFRFHLAALTFHTCGFNPAGRSMFMIPPRKSAALIL